MMSAFGLSPPDPSQTLQGISWDAPGPVTQGTPTTKYNSHHGNDTKEAAVKSATDLRMRGTTNNLGTGECHIALGTDNLDATWSKKLRSFHLPYVGSLVSEFKIVFHSKKSRLLLVLFVVNMLCTTLLTSWSGMTNSLVLQSCMYHTCFTLLSLCVSLSGIWIEQQKRSLKYTFGHERFDVLALFGSTVLVQLGAIMVFKEGIERVLSQPEINTHYLMLGGGVSLFCQLIVVMLSSNKALDHVITASSSSWLQEHIADISYSLCAFIPALSRLLLPRLNPVVLVAFTGASAVFGANLFIEVYNWPFADSIAAAILAAVTCGTFFPMSVYTGRILLQTTPSHLVSQLDKCLREALTLDGVLEFRHEHFWTLSFGKMAGSLHVRVRRDADEQLVLAHVVDRLSNLVPVLTVQVVKDDWTHTVSPLPSLEESLLLVPRHSSEVESPTGLPYPSPPWLSPIRPPKSIENAFPIRQNPFVTQTVSLNVPHPGTQLS